MNTMRKEGARGVVELVKVVAIESTNNETKLSGDLSKEVRECGEGVRLLTQWEVQRK
jgi:hypothetical protein